MEKNKQEYKEVAFLKKYIKEVEIKQTPENFTQNLMAVLVKEEKQALVKNKPLISKSMWLLVASFVGVCLFFVFKNQKSSVFLLPKYDLSFMSKIEMPNLFASVSVSNGMLLFFGLFTLFFFVQVFFLKNHINKRFEV